MRALTLFGEILPVLGTVGLLGLWLYQQVGIERRSSELQKLSAAHSIYQTYQSNNALFNALNELMGKDKRASERLREFQIYNYELGLQAIEQVLPDSTRSKIPAAPDAYDSNVGYETKMDQTQARLERLQGALSARQEVIRRAAADAKGLYLKLYIAISLTAILGSALKVVDKLTTAAH